MNAVWIALIVALSSMSSPLLLAHLTNRQRRQDKLEDWKRTDDVAAQAAEAASLLLEANERVAETAAVANNKLDVIHELVNSNMTASKQSELVALKGQVVLMERVLALNEAAGDAPTKDELAAVEAVEAQVAELEAVIGDRLKQQRQIDDNAIRK